MQCKGYGGWDLNKAISKIRWTTRLPSPLKIFPDGRSSTFTQQESKVYRILCHPNRFQSKQYGATEETTCNVDCSQLFRSNYLSS